MLSHRTLPYLVGLAALNCCLCLSLVADPPPAAPRYDVTDLGEMPTVSDDVSLSLNESGQVAGWQETGGVVHAALWTDGKARDLGAPAGFVSSISRAVNRRGQVVGWATTSRNLVDSLAATHACLFEPDGKAADLGTLGGRDSQAFGINSAGDIVGGSLRADGIRHAFLYKHGKMTDLGALPGGKFSLAYAINDAGDIAGISETATHTQHGFLWKKGKLTDLGALPEGRISLAFALNSRGEVAGSAERDQEYHATHYAAGKLEDLGTLGSDPAAATGINNRGQIVGASNLSTIKRHAFLWENGKMTDLNDLILPASEWTLLNAAAINGAGSIVGTARGKTGTIHIVLLLPASP